MLDEVIKANVKDAERLIKIAEDSKDKDLLEAAKQDLQKWQDKLNEKH